MERVPQVLPRFGGSYLKPAEGPKVAPFGVHHGATSQPCQNVGHSRNRRIHVLKRRRQAEAEPHPVAAMVGMNVGGGERCLDSRGMRRMERKKVAVSGVLAERCDKVGTGQTLQAEWLEMSQEVRHQGGRVSVHPFYTKAVRGHPGEHRALPIDADRIESRTQEARTAGGIADGPFRRGRKRAEFSEPARVAWPRTVARRTMQEANALARHGVFVSTSEVEHPAGNV